VEAPAVASVAAPSQTQAVRAAGSGQSANEPPALV
jgi:hypothetical protein